MTRHDRLASYERYLQLRPFTPKGLVLVLLGIIFVVLGVSAVLEPWTPSQREALWLLVELGPRAAWGAMSILAGLAAIWSSLWPTWNDSWGFVALAGMSSWWASAFAIGVIAHGLVALSGTLTWLSMCVLLWAISRLSDPLEQDQP